MLDDFPDPEAEDIAEARCARRCRRAWATYTQVVTAIRDELHQLIDELPDDQLPGAADDLRRRTKPRPPHSPEPLAWIGMIKDGPTDASSPEAIDKALGDGFGRR
jgi:hypothetical protein